MYDLIKRGAKSLAWRSPTIPNYLQLKDAIAAAVSLYQNQKIYVLKINTPYQSRRSTDINAFSLVVTTF